MLNITKPLVNIEKCRNNSAIVCVLEFQACLVLIVISGAMIRVPLVVTDGQVTVMDVQLEPGESSVKVSVLKVVTTPAVRQTENASRAAMGCTAKTVV